MKDKQLDTVGKRIRECRKKAGYSQEEMAAILCVHRSTFNKYENGLRDISISTINEIAKILNTTSGYLLNGDAVPDSWIYDMMGILVRIQSGELKELVRKQLTAVLEFCKCSEIVNKK